MSQHGRKPDPSSGDLRQPHDAITTLERRVAQLEESERRLRLALEAGALGIWEVDLEAKTLYLDRRCCEIYGEEQDEFSPLAFVGAQRDRFIHPDDYDRVQRAISAAMDPSHPEDTFAIEHRLREPNQHAWVAVCGEVRFVEQGSRRKPVRIFGTTQDISARKRDEQALEQLRQQAEAANRSKSEFLATLSHELRTPLTAILGYTQLLGERFEQLGPAGLGECVTYVETIRRNGAHMLEVLNDILDMSKIEAGKLEVERARVELPRLLSDVLALMAVSARAKQLSLTLAAQGPLPATIETGAKPLRQILMNLIGNAIKFTEAGGVEVLCRLLPEAEQLRIDVIDTGVGIDEAQQAVLFQPFVQLVPKCGRELPGTGLGLPISKRLAQMLGGDIELASEPGRGSRFTLTIPTGSLADVEWARPEQLGERPMRAPSSPNPRARPRLRVLLVEDCSDLVALYTSFLAPHCKELRSAATGDAALRIAAEFPADVVLLDLGLPDVSGFELAHQLRKLPQLECARFIALTGHSERDAGGWREAGFSEYLLKPVDLDLLARLVRNHE